MPIYYECQRCTACCRWPGLVRLAEVEVDAIAAHLGMDARVFVQQYTVLGPERRGLVLTDQPGGACVFLDGSDCRIQAVKPKQCRDFPNGWNFSGFLDHCRAIPREVSDAEYTRLTGKTPSALPVTPTEAGGAATFP